ncbi:LOW QUALITY PROTEIN: hypothetical protein CVT26_006296 [Gymnopilus dilepis]|uniref:Uncharacterized protein n=1 Tax=Gymnopilus dilepis TaxID=231916 RepID=A0A409Y0P1_9AGAR|nr:LOW QUALITY PROTEIN: hypothetical protein CVT26_006296 [Gymnopilus dilepis]
MALAGGSGVRRRQLRPQLVLTNEVGAESSRAPASSPLSQLADKPRGWWQQRRAAPTAPTEADEPPPSRSSMGGRWSLARAAGARGPHYTPCSSSRAKRGQGGGDGDDDGRVLDRRGEMPTSDSLFYAREMGVGLSKREKISTPGSLLQGEGGRGGTKQGRIKPRNKEINISKERKKMRTYTRFPRVRYPHLLGLPHRGSPLCDAYPTYLDKTHILGGAETAMEGRGGGGCVVEGRRESDAQAVDPISAIAGQPIQADLGRETRLGALTPSFSANMNQRRVRTSTPRVIVFIGKVGKCKRKLDNARRDVAAANAASSNTTGVGYPPSLSPSMPSPPPPPSKSSTTCPPPPSRTPIQLPRWCIRLAAHQRANRREPHVVAWRWRRPDTLSGHGANAPRTFVAATTTSRITSTAHHCSLFLLPLSQFLSIFYHPKILDVDVDRSTMSRVAQVLMWHLPPLLLAPSLMVCAPLCSLCCVMLKGMSVVSIPYLLFLIKAFLDSSYCIWRGEGKWCCLASS